MKSQNRLFLVWMYTRVTIPLLIALTVPAVTSECDPNIWPRFRGPNGCGVAPGDAQAPVEFAVTNNLLWAAQTMPGHSSPCIWGDRIFLTAFDEGRTRLITLCFDRRNGRQLWLREAPETTLDPSLHRFNNPASSTPASDGKRVFSYFGSFGLQTFDIHGTELWRLPIPTPPTKYGFASSPIVVGDMVILQLDGNSTNSALLAIDVETGRVRWQAPRPLHEESWSTPIVWEHGDTDELITAGNGRVDAYDVHGGQHRWWTPGMTMQPIHTPVASDDSLFVSATGTGDPGQPSEALNLESWFSRFDADQDGQLIPPEMPENEGIQIRPEVSKDVPGNFYTYREMIFDLCDLDKDGIFTREEADIIRAWSNRNRDNVLAIRPGGNGNILETHVRWTGGRGVSEMPSPILYRGRLWFVRDGGMVTSYDAQTGRVILDRERLGVVGQYAASLVASGGHLYACSVAGKVVVFKAVDYLDVVAVNNLRESVMATPAIVAGRIYLRTDTHLYAFGG